MSTSASARLARCRRFRWRWRRAGGTPASITQVRAAHRVVAFQLRAAALDSEATHLEHVGLARHVQREAGILLHEQDRDPVLGVDGANDLEDRAHDKRRKTE